jgi:hypothetical protein
MDKRVLDNATLRPAGKDQAFLREKGGGARNVGGFRKLGLVEVLPV